MNPDNELYRIVWTQVYHAWTQPQESEITDLTEARAVLARIMALLNGSLKQLTTKIRCLTASTCWMIQRARCMRSALRRVRSKHSRTRSALIPVGVSLWSTLCSFEQS